MIPASEITRPILGNVPPSLQTLFYAVTFGACAAGALLFWRRLRLHRRLSRRAAARAAAPSAGGAARSGAGPDAQPAAGLRPAARLGAVLSYLTFHRELRRDRFAGLAHLLTVYGFAVLFAGTCLVFLEHDTPLDFFHGPFYLGASLVIDLGGAAFLAGLGMFLWRRLRRNEPRLLQAGWVSALAWLLLAIGVSGFLVEAARIARDLPAFERWSVVGYGAALGLRALGIAGEAAAVWHRAGWILHAALCAAFFALLPWRFFGHMAYGAVSWAVRGAAPRGALPVTPVEARAPGAVTAADLSWRDLLHADACTACGRCNEVCPADEAGKPLRPREVILGLRAALDAAAASRAAAPPAAAGAGNGTALAAHVPDAMLWSCTTCSACNEACPVGIEIVEKIVEARRGRVEAGDAPAAAVDLFDASAEKFNPYGKAAGERLAWASGLGVREAAAGEPIDLLYWVGCAGSFDPDGQSVSRAMVRILDHLGVPYRVLGRRERCTGDPARRLGEEGLFQRLARLNIARLAEHGVRRVLTHCPHCFNTFRNEYPALGGAFEVEHHTQFLARMIREGRLRPLAGGSDVVAFHDPCYLGRGNGEVEAPRQVLAALPGLERREMPRSGARSFCCGAGGGSMWLDVAGRTRIETIRAAEASATGATVVATGCPFCKTMLEAGRQSLAAACGARKVKDVAELVVEAGGL
jgi:Fe-S oxidoreductase